MDRFQLAQYRTQGVQRVMDAWKNKRLSDEDRAWLNEQRGQMRDQWGREAELHPLRMGEIELGQRARRQQIEQGAELHPLRKEGMLLGQAATRQQMAQGAAAESRAAGQYERGKWQQATVYDKDGRPILIERNVDTGEQREIGAGEGRSFFPEPKPELTGKDRATFVKDISAQFNRRVLDPTSGFTEADWPAWRDAKLQEAGFVSAKDGGPQIDFGGFDVKSDSDWTALLMDYDAAPLEMQSAMIDAMPPDVFAGFKKRLDARDKQQAQQAKADSVATAKSSWLKQVSSTPAGRQLLQEKEERERKSAQRKADAKRKAEQIRQLY